MSFFVCYNLDMNPNIKSEIIQEYRNIYISLEKPKPLDSQIINLYKFASETAMKILGEIILFENEFKISLSYVLSKEYENKIGKMLKQIKDPTNHYEKRLKNFIREKKDEWNNFQELVDALMFGQAITLIKLLDIEKLVSNEMEIFSGLKNQLLTLKAFRNSLAHGSPLQSSTKGGFTLAKCLKYLFRWNKNLKYEITNMLSLFNFSKIGIKLIDILKYLKIQGLFDQYKFKNIDIEQFYDFYLGYYYDKIKKGSQTIKSEFAKLFGIQKYKKIFNESTTLKKVINKKFISRYKTFLTFKKSTKISTWERLILRILMTTQNMKIPESILLDISHYSLVDLNKLKEICRSFKIEVIRNDNQFNTKQIIINKHILSGYKLYKENYLVNRKFKIIKMKDSPPYFKYPFKSKRNNGLGNICYQVSINGSSEYLHKIIAKLFLPNPNNYKFVAARNGDYINCTFTDLRWIEYSAKPRITNSLKRREK